MKVLVACEFSGVVREAFLRRGHDAWSCDLLPTEIPGPHIQDDIMKHLDAGWDMMIAHPPCTHLSISGSRWFKDKRVQQEDALTFVRMLLDAAIPKIALENPISIISSRIRRPDQIIQPYQFGHDASKATCLWLKNLPKLVLDPANYVSPRLIDNKKRWANQTDSGQNKLTPSPTRAKERSITYEGIANAMAWQWG